MNTELKQLIELCLLSTMVDRVVKFERSNGFPAYHVHLILPNEIAYKLIPCALNVYGCTVKHKREEFHEAGVLDSIDEMFDLNWNNEVYHMSFIGEIRESPDGKTCDVKVCVGVTDEELETWRYDSISYTVADHPF